MTKKEYCIKHAPIASHEYYTSHIHGIEYGINDYVYVSQKRQLKLFSDLYKWDFHKCKVYTDQNGEMYFNFTEKNYNGTKTTTRRYINEYIRRGTWLPEMSPETWEKECKEVQPMTINIKTFEKQFQDEYNFLYENDDNVAGYKEAVAAFDEFLSKNKNFVCEFVKYRGDFISSDREAAAFMFTLSNWEA